jgi:hypothetical protein
LVESANHPSKSTRQLVDVRLPTRLGQYHVGLVVGEIVRQANKFFNLASITPNYELRGNGGDKISNNRKEDQSQEQIVD